MKPFEWVALIGALAWLPHLISLLRAALTKPEVRIITENKVELGFTTLGPILNLRIAFAVKNKDIVISAVRIRVKHDGGEERIFSWHSVTQRMLQMNTPETGPIPFEKEITVLAIKLLPKDIEERTIRFQDSKYHADKEEHEIRVGKRLTYICRGTGSIEYEEFLKSEEMKDLCSFISHSFGWKSGRFKADFQVDSPESLSLKNSLYEFELTPLDIEHVDKNKQLIEKYYEHQFLPAKEGEERETLILNWRYPLFKNAI